MDSLFVFLALLTIIAIPYVLGHGVYQVIKFLFDLVADSFGTIQAQISAPIYQSILTNQFAYYRSLPAGKKNLFLARVKHFAESKEFVGRNNLVVTDEMKVLISASAVQLTFGLNEYLLHHFKKIFIYPDVYYSKVTHKYHMGDVNLGGAIAISWKSFKEGYASPSDNYNVGLHEMAHALRFAHIRKDDFDHFFAAYFDKWTRISADEMSRIKKGEPSMLREYAGTNINEFFAVCTEYFFESPAEFKKKLPEIYKHMSILLNQDPLELSANPLSVRKKWLSPFAPTALAKPVLITGLNIVPILLFCAFSFLVLLIAGANGGLREFTSGTVLLFSPIAIAFALTARKVKRIKFFENGMEFQFPLLGKKYVFLYENIVSVTFHRVPIEDLEDEQRGVVGMVVKNSLNIVYADGDEIDEMEFTLHSDDAAVQKMISHLRKEKFLLKIYGEKWKEEPSHENHKIPARPETEPFRMNYSGKRSGGQMTNPQINHKNQNQNPKRSA